eukprot:CAMPEP_0179277422 /NCGR_PEP_ID=MMETSP0797-20121207/35086_1 /TAXON_ID=47934 /ORGANISM="Dinophysis acuminata, Strain DAEP01" /LENGTH=221 /DNA_ID=CAMNT_0020986011 /DNA_START=205 /DNA_END=868 /DNA_ORIENTATION=+
MTMLGKNTVLQNARRWQRIRAHESRSSAVWTSGEIGSSAVAAAGARASSELEDEPRWRHVLVSQVHLDALPLGEPVDGSPDTDVAAGVVRVRAPREAAAAREQRPPGLQVPGDRLLRVVVVDVDERRRPSHAGRPALVRLGEGVGEIPHEHVPAVEGLQPVAEVLEYFLVLPVVHVCGVVVPAKDVDVRVYQVDALHRCPIFQEPHREVPAADAKDDAEAT